MMKSENFPKIFLNICFLELSEEFPRDSKQVLVSHGKRIISVGVTEVLCCYEILMADLQNLTFGIAEIFLVFFKVSHKHQSVTILHQPGYLMYKIQTSLSKFHQLKKII